MKLKHVHAVVTGGASGRGLAEAENIIAGGGQVALFDVNEELGQALALQLGEAATFHKVDVT
ncbi:MAG TPA: SDR family NAD(P)-dependent oxidoreductase, partial [Steroidobacteraceae bacterium]|nr:SDR family NAD(P)-dependent oxidoreductase [Steroidobacteraceae bacterium]